jgi:uncharacterized repeat protein (TIGR04138 family)
MTQFDEALTELLERDPRYAPEAYEFIFQALHHSQQMLDRAPPEDQAREPGTAVDAKHHVSGPELLEGVRDLALQQFGRMARTVFRMWGVNRTADFGEIVFNLIEAGLMSKTDQDRRQDFHDVYDLDEALVQGYRISLTNGE